MTKARLRNYLNLRKEQEQLRHRLVELETALYSPKIPRLTDMPKGGSHEGNAQEDLAIHHIELQELYVAKLAVLEAEQLEIEKAIASLSPIERLLLRFRYLDGLKWEEVCVKINYEWTQTHEIHAKALRKLEAMEMSE